MLRVAPFAALRPQPNLAARVASVPYDVVSTEEAREMTRNNDVSFLHVIRPEVDLPDGTDPHDEAVYAKGRENLDRLVRDGTLLREDEPTIYLYRQVMDHRPQIGVVCCGHVGDYADNLIRKHELTRKDKEDDRTRHVLTLNANAGPVFLTYRDDPTLERLIALDTNRRPLYHFDAPDGVTHTVWPVANQQAYVDAFRQIPHAYVADGHHRAASAARAGAARREADPGHTGDAEYDWFLTVLFPASQLHILPYNRILRDLGGLSAADALERLRDVGTLTPTDDPAPGGPGAFCVYLDGAWYRLEIDAATIDADDPVASLDVALLHDRVLQPIFGIGDVRSDPRLEFVGGIRGTGALQDLVDSGHAAVAFSMHATTIDQLMRVSDAGLIMPPKSTWFEPKLRSGLLVHTLD